MQHLVILAFIGGLIWKLVQKKPPHQPGLSDSPKYQKLINLSTVLLLASIGLSGGHEIVQVTFVSVLTTGLVSVCLSITQFGITYLVLSRFSDYGKRKKLCWCAHQSSVSVSTLIIATVYYVQAGFEISPIVPILLVLMEISSPLVSVLLAEGKSGIGRVFRHKSIVFIFTFFLLGMFTSEAVYKFIFPFIKGPIFYVALCLFLFDKGHEAAKYIDILMQNFLKIISFALFLSFIGAGLALSVGTLMHFPVPLVAILTVLMSSASYVLATAIMEGIVEDRSAIALSLTASLLVIFMFNMVAGIRLYLYAAQLYHRSQLFNMSLAWPTLGIISGIVLIILLSWPDIRLRELYRSFLNKRILAKRLKLLSGAQSTHGIVKNCPSADYTWSNDSVKSVGKLEACPFRDYSWHDNLRQIIFPKNQ